MAKNRRMRAALEQERKEKLEKDKEMKSLVGRLSILEKRGNNRLEDDDDCEDQGREEIHLKEEV